MKKQNKIKYYYMTKREYDSTIRYLDEASAKIKKLSKIIGEHTKRLKREEKLKKRVLNLEQELKLVWTIIKQRDEYIFGGKYGKRGKNQTNKKRD